MEPVVLTIDEAKISVPKGTTILDAARQAGVYIPHLCSHVNLPHVKGMKPAESVYRGALRLENKRPDIEEYEGCQLCVVQIEGREGLQRSCCTEVNHGMLVHTNIPEIQEFRRKRLESILAKHPHACLTCTQKEGCARFPCSMNIPENERCCSLFGSCEFQKVAEYVGINADTPRYVFEDLPVLENEPLFERNYNLCIGCTRCIRVCREVRGVDALDFVFDKEGRVIVGTTKPTLAGSACIFCTACVEVCPTGTLVDKEQFEGVPCKNSCPAEIDIPRYVRLISEGKCGEAFAVIREKVVFPRILGRICPHDCELSCRRGDVNEPIAIRALKRFAAEQDDKRWKERLTLVKSTYKKVAIIGSGPAGLAAAYYLTRLGHSVTVFEAASEAGGMMRMGIPNFLLPQEVLKQDISEILSFGIELKLDSPIDDISQLIKDGYNAVLVAIGMQEGMKLPIPGNDLEGSLIGLGLLRDINEGKKVYLGQNTLVLGGGGVACDVARTVKRLGVSKVAMACLESLETIPAPSHDIQQAEEEGIKIFPSHSFTQILGENGQVKGVECLQVKWMKFDEQGRIQLETFADSGHILKADTVIFAIGQALGRHFVERNRLELTKRGIIKASPDTLETNTKGVFVSGDAAIGPASVVEAAATARKAAMSIDKYLGGSGILEEELSKDREMLLHLGGVDGFAEKPRIEVPLLSTEKRVGSFEEVELTLSPRQAVAEAGRCLRCELRLEISKPILPPKKKLWVEFTKENVAAVPEVDGVYQLLDEQESVIYIKGAMNLRSEIEEQLELSENARYFMYEEEPMYTKKESELLQQYIAEHGEMPEGNRELDDLF